MANDAKATQARRDARRKAGMCWQCGVVPVFPGQVRCDACRSKRAAAARKREAAYKGIGICPRCQAEPLADGSALCNTCYAKRVTRERQLEFERRLEADLVAQGIETR